MGKKSKRSLVAATHEAAHAVIAHVLGEKVTAVVLKGRGGWCDHSTTRLPDPLRLGIIAMAGHAAEIRSSRFRPGKRTRVPADDHTFLVSMGFRGRSLATLLSMSLVFVTDYKAEIAAVAKELEERDLYEKDFRRMMRKLKVRADE
jgi:hypothetical protein